jgi:uncharacterized protein YkwD
MHIKHLILAASALIIGFISTGCGENETTTSSTNDSTYSSANKSKWWHRNNPPVASISGVTSYVSGENATLDATASYDRDGDKLTYTWRQLSGASVTLANISSSVLQFVTPEVTEASSIVFELIVSDGTDSDMARVGLTITPAFEDTLPSVTSISPQENQNDVAPNSSISITFSEALLQSSINASSLSLSHNGVSLAGTLSYSGSNYSLTFTPAQELDPATLYHVTLSNDLKDLDGNSIAAKSWDFTTLAAATEPENSETSVYNLGSTSQETIDACMDTNDKEMLTQINNARTQARNCGDTNYPAAPALSWNCLLENAATTHSQSMADNDYFSHTGIDGSSPGDRISAAGYNWRTYGENIAAGYPDTKSVMQGWLESAGHCANIMNANFSEVGAGMAQGGSYDIYWTQDFAASF